MMSENTLRTDANHSDLILELLIEMIKHAEKSEDKEGADSISITVNVGGLLISGTLISGKRYLDEFLSGVMRDKIKNAINSDESLKEEIQKAPIGKEAFIHLRDARFFLPGQKPVPGVGDGVLWRGRMDSVEGFFLGKLGIA
jgi:hypothetical protein